MTGFSDLRAADSPGAANARAVGPKLRPRPCLPTILRPHPPVQDAPRAWRSNSDRLAITRSASPNSACSCAWFFASPL